MRGSVRRRTIKVHAQEVIAEIIVSRVPSTNYAEIRKMWDEWDLRNGKKDDQLEFDGFYDGFLEGLNRLIINAINKPCKETS